MDKTKKAASSSRLFFYRSRKSEVRSRILLLLAVVEDLQRPTLQNPNATQHAKPQILCALFSVPNRRRSKLSITCVSAPLELFSKDVTSRFSCEYTTRQERGPPGARRPFSSEQMVHVSQKETGHLLLRFATVSRPRGWWRAFLRDQVAARIDYRRKPFRH